MRLVIILSGGSLLLIMSLTVILHLNYVQAQGSIHIPSQLIHLRMVFHIRIGQRNGQLGKTTSQIHTIGILKIPQVLIMYPKDCSYMQDPSSPVFFLPWVGAEQGTSATVTCIVPHNKAILISVDAGHSRLQRPEC